MLKMLCTYYLINNYILFTILAIPAVVPENRIVALYRSIPMNGGMKLEKYKNGKSHKCT